MDSAQSPASITPRSSPSVSASPASSRQARHRRTGSPGSSLADNRSRAPSPCCRRPRSFSRPARSGTRRSGQSDRAAQRLTSRRRARVRCPRRRSSFPVAACAGSLSRSKARRRPNRRRLSAGCPSTDLPHYGHRTRYMNALNDGIDTRALPHTLYPAQRNPG